MKMCATGGGKIVGAFLLACRGWFRSIESRFRVDGRARARIRVGAKIFTTPKMCQHGFPLVRAPPATEVFVDGNMLASLAGCIAPVDDNKHMVVAS